MIKGKGRNDIRTENERQLTSHQLLIVNHVCLVQNDTDLVVVSAERLNRALELVRNVEFVRVKQQDNAIGTLSKPLDHVGKVVLPTEPLLLAREHTGRVDECDLFENRCRANGRLELVQKRHA